MFLSIVFAITFSTLGCMEKQESDITAKILNYDYTSVQSVLTCDQSADHIMFSPDGKILMSVKLELSNESIKFWDPYTGKCIKTLDVQAINAAFSPNSEILASANFNSTVQLWDTSTGDCIATLEGHSDRVRDVIFSPDGSTLASASNNKTIKIHHFKKASLPLEALLQEKISNNNKENHQEFNETDC